jgi:hypothetical protein
MALHEIPNEPLVLGTEGAEKQLRAYFEKRKSLVAAMRAQIAGMEKKWGKDQAAWAVILRMAKAHGGLEALQAPAGYTAQYRGVMYAAGGVVTNHETTLDYRFPNDLKLTSILGGKRQIICYTPAAAWQQVGDEIYPSSRSDLAPQARAIMARHLFFCLVRSDCGNYIVTKLDDESLNGEKFDRLKVMAPDVAYEILVDQATHRLKRVSYHEPTAGSEGSVLDFSYREASRGVLLPSEIVITNGSHKEGVWTLRNFQLRSRGSRAEFSNPLVGLPFRGGNGRNYSITILNHTPGQVFLYIDDSATPRTLRWPNGTADLTLEGGRHQLTVVGTYGGGSHRRQKVYRYNLYVSHPGYLNVTYNGSAYEGTGSLGVVEEMY